MKVPVSIFLVLVLVAGIVAQNKPDPEYRSYLAHIAAASQSLRLNETAELKRWLAAAPAKYRGWEWRYLSAMAEQSASSFDLKNGGVTSIAISPDGKLIAVTGSDRSVRLVNSATGAEVWNKTDEKIVPQSVAFYPSGRRLAAAYSRHSVKVWDISSGQESLKLQGKGRGITAVAFSPDGRSIAACSWKFDAKQQVTGIVEIWNAETGASIRELEYGVKPLTAIAYSSDGKHLAVGSWEVQKTVAVWDTASWDRPDLYESEADDTYKAVQAIAFSPDGTKLAAGGKDSCARVWDVASRKLLFRAGGAGKGHAKWVNGVAFSGDSKTLATASTDQTLRFWNIADGKEITTLRGHTKGLNSVRFMPGGDAVTASSDGTIRRWNTENTINSSGNWPHPGSVYGVNFSADGKTAVTAAWKGGLRLAEANTGRPLKDWTGHIQSANAAAISPDGKFLASVGNDGKIKLWDAATQKELRVFEEVKGPQLVSVGFASGGKYVFAASSGGHAKVWDVSTGKVVFDLDHGSEVLFTAMSKDGSTLATGGTDGSLAIWNAATGAAKGKIQAHKARITSIAFSPDGRTVATSGGDKTIRTFDVKTMKETRVLSGHDEAINGIAYSPDGTRLVSASSDQTVRLWDTRTGESVLTLYYDTEIWGAQFTPNGTRLAVLPIGDSVWILDAGLKGK